MLHYSSRSSHSNSPQTKVNQPIRRTLHEIPRTNYSHNRLLTFRLPIFLKRQSLRFFCGKDIIRSFLRRYYAAAGLRLNLGTLLLPPTKHQLFQAVFYDLILAIKPVKTSPGPNSTNSVMLSSNILWTSAVQLTGEVS